MSVTVGMAARRVSSLIAGLRYHSPPRRRSRKRKTAWSATARERPFLNFIRKESGEMPGRKGAEIGACGGRKTPLEWREICDRQLKYALIQSFKFQAFFAS
jgi:hypothetical protein